MGNCCCDNAYLVALIQQNEKLLCAIQDLQTVNPDAVEDIKRMQAHINPMTVKGEYPTALADRFVVSCPTVRFLDMLNTDLYVIFKIDNINFNLPVYFKDSVGYEHPVVLSDATPVICNQLILNGIYKAKYQYSGSYIILDSLTPLNPDIIPITLAVSENKLKKNVRNK